MLIYEILYYICMQASIIERKKLLSTNSIPMNVKFYQILSSLKLKYRPQDSNTQCTFLVSKLILA